MSSYETPTLPVAANSDASSRGPALRPVAPAWHTLVLILFLLANSFWAARSPHATAGAAKFALYGVTIALEWVMVAYIAWGIHKRGLRMSDLNGRRWKSPEEFLLDVGIAFGTWIALGIGLSIFGVIAMKLHWLDLKQLPQMRKAIEFIVPKTAAEIALFSALAATAGICEEIIFRGYFQQQFGYALRNIWLGTLASALLFGSSHLYEGPFRMGAIVIIGMLLGTLANLRRNLRPGMIAHAWFDFFSGVVGPKIEKLLPPLK